MIKVYFGNDKDKKCVGESETDDGAFRIIEDYVKKRYWLAKSLLSFLG